jgi:hypothetical protein
MVLVFYRVATIVVDVNGSSLILIGYKISNTIKFLNIYFFQHQYHLDKGGGDEGGGDCQGTLILLSS